MNRLILVVLAAAALAFGQADNAKQGNRGPQAKVLTRAEIDSLLSKPDQILIIDVRRPDEISAVGGFPVYLNIQIGDLEKRLAWIPKDRTIIALSNHATRGGRAADILTKAGFKVAGAAGAQTYEQEGGTLTKIVPPAPSPSASATKQ